MTPGGDVGICDLYADKTTKRNQTTHGYTALTIHGCMDLYPISDVRVVNSSRCGICSYRWGSVRRQRWAVLVL